MKAEHLNRRDLLKTAALTLACPSLPEEAAVVIPKPKPKCTGIPDSNGIILYVGDRIKTLCYYPYNYGRDAENNLLPDYYYARVVYGKYQDCQRRFHAQPEFGLLYENVFHPQIGSYRPWGPLAVKGKDGRPCYDQLNKHTCRVGEPIVLVSTVTHSPVTRK